MKSTLENHMRFALWASQLRRLPNCRQVMERFELKRAAAYHWIAALRAARGMP